MLVGLCERICRSETPELRASSFLSWRKWSFTKYRDIYLSLLHGIISIPRRFSHYFLGNPKRKIDLKFGISFFHCGWMLETQTERISNSFRRSKRLYCWFMNHNLWFIDNESSWNSRISLKLFQSIKYKSIYHLKIFFVGYEFNISAPLYKPNFVRINFESLVLILLDLAGLGRSGRWALVAFKSISSPTSSLNLFFSQRTLFMFSIL